MPALVGEAVQRSGKSRLQSLRPSVDELKDSRRSGTLGSLRRGTQGQNEMQQRPPFAVCSARCTCLAMQLQEHRHKLPSSTAELDAFGIPSRLSSYLLAFPSSAYQLFWVSERANYGKALRALGSRQEQWEADVRRTWETPEPQRKVRARVQEKARACNSFQIKAKEWEFRPPLIPRNLLILQDDRTIKTSNSLKCGYTAGTPRF